jgi:diguanylate cyclase (GGDEF)-like protein
MKRYIGKITPFAYAAFAAIVSMWLLAMFMSISQEIQLSITLLISFLIGLMAFNIAGAIDARSYKKMTRDPESGARTRQYFIDISEREISRSIRSQTPIYAIAFKLDQYEEIHSEAPKCIATIFEQMTIHLRKNTRKNDVLARLSDNAFVLLLSDDTKEEHTGMLAERVQNTVNSLMCTANNKTYQNLTATTFVEPYDMDNDMSSEDFTTRLENILENA